MAGLVTDLPDALVGVTPCPHGQVRQLGQEGTIRRRQLAACPREEVRSVHELTVGVELELVGGAVAHAYRSRAEMAGEMGQVHFWQQALTGDPVHDLQIIGAACAGALEPSLERVGLTERTEDDQRGERQGGVSNPGEPVVPVAFASDPLRKRCRAGSDHRAGRRVGQRLQDERRAMHRSMVFALVGAAPIEPVLPERHRVGEPVDHRRPAVLRPRTDQHPRLGSRRPRSIPPRRRRGPTRPRT